MSVMDVARRSIFVNCNLRGHATKLEEVHFLPVAFQNRMRWVGQTDKGQFVIFCQYAEKEFASSGPTTTISVSCAVNLS